MELEYEIESYLGTEQENLLNYCPSCGNLIYGNFCDKCKKPTPTEKFSDPDFDDYFETIEKEGIDFDKEMKDPNQWKEVLDEEGAN